MEENNDDDLKFDGCGLMNNILFIGKGGVGKSMIMPALLNLYPPVDTTDEETIRIIDRLNECTEMSFDILTETCTEPFQNTDVDQLKKRIKRSKNQLEINMLNRELNSAYKEMRRK